ncbi:MAG: alpha/beta fold hydrolase [Pyrinomonadaceae bacterium]
MSTGFELTINNAPQDVTREDERAAFCLRIARVFEEKSFKPHPLFTSGHAQTIAGHMWPRRFSLRADRAGTERIFEVEPGVRILAHCRWQPDPVSRPTIVLTHGLEGSSESVYMLGTAGKAFRAGFNVVRLNLRNCGNTEHLTPTLYNSGLSGDLRAVVRELIEQDSLPHIFVVGFSMGGNMALKLAGEDADAAPRELSGICAVSPSVDLSTCADAIEQRSNWLYQRSFMRSLRRRIRQKERLYPDRFDASDLRSVRTIRDFDNRYTALDAGYRDAADYYERASALPLISQIRTPTLIIHAQDDPFIPFHPLRHRAVAENPCVLLQAPPHGGHVGFVAADTSGEDRFWAENRIVEFCGLVHDRAAR